jgi:hypothetical protein
MASNISAPGSVEPTERIATVDGRMRWRISQPSPVIIRQQSGSATRCTDES